MEVHVHHEAGGFQIEGQAELHSEFYLSQQISKKKKEEMKEDKKGEEGEEEKRDKQEQLPEPCPHL